MVSKLGFKLILSLRCLEITQLDIVTKKVHKIKAKTSAFILWITFPSEDLKQHLFMTLKECASENVLAFLKVHACLTFNFVTKLLFY